MNSKFWDERYLSGQHGWDVGAVTEPLKKFIDSIENKNISILIPGCGNAYEAEYLLQNGFTNITLIDISPVLVDDIKKKFAGQLGKNIQVVCEDFFDFEGSFDLILEQTFFCAINPARRGEYVAKMKQLLAPEGKLAGVLFNREFAEAGPPFGGNKEEYLKLFEPELQVIKMETCYNSIKPRDGNELFFIVGKN